MKREPIKDVKVTLTPMELLNAIEQLLEPATRARPIHWTRVR